MWPVQVASMNKKMSAVLTRHKYIDFLVSVKNILSLCEDNTSKIL
jgi:hypothetical protein